MPHIQKSSSTPSHPISAHSPIQPSAYAYYAHTPGNPPPCSTPSSCIFRIHACTFKWWCGRQRCQRRHFSLLRRRCCWLCVGREPPPRLPEMRTSQPFFAWQLSYPRSGRRPYCRCSRCCSLRFYLLPLCWWVVLTLCGRGFIAPRFSCPESPTYPPTLQCISSRPYLLPPVPPASR